MLKTEGWQPSRTATWIQILILRQPGCVTVRTMWAHEVRLLTTAPHWAVAPLSARSAQNSSGEEVQAQDSETSGHSAFSTVTPWARWVSPSWGLHSLRPGLLPLTLSLVCYLSLTSSHSLLRNLKNHQYKNHEIPQFLLKLSHLPSSFLLNIENISIKLSPLSSSIP